MDQMDIPELQKPVVPKKTPNGMLHLLCPTRKLSPPQIQRGREFRSCCWLAEHGWWDGTHAGCCQRNLPALRSGESVLRLFKNAGIHLSAVRKGRSAFGL